MKKFVIFLPQFHQIPENDKWWGDGFTEWNKVKEAEPLYKYHDQPKIPLNDNYYNLLDKSTVIWQTELSHKYHIDGFIYYHYYFNGKLLLEKPAENLLRWKDIDQKFFFCWANHSWKRSWEGKQTILIEQSYGDIEDWEQHFQYLLPFFRDERYEKIENKPIFEIYNTFEKEDSMIRYFDQRCKECGFAGIYIIQTFQSNCHNIKKSIYSLLKKTGNQVAAIHLRQPSFGIAIINSNIFNRILIHAKRFFLSKGIKFIDKGKLLNQYDGNKVLKKSMDINHYKINYNTIPGLFFEWDNTPRHKYRGYIISAINKKIFIKYMNSIRDKEYIFINAWNEWAEGMMMEPTKNNGFKYLEWIKEWSEKYER